MRAPTLAEGLSASAACEALTCKQSLTDVWAELPSNSPHPDSERKPISQTMAPAQIVVDVQRGDPQGLPASRGDKAADPSALSASTMSEQKGSGSAVLYTPDKDLSETEETAEVQGTNAPLTERSRVEPATESEPKVELDLLPFPESSAGPERSLLPSRAQPPKPTLPRDPWPGPPGSGSALDLEAQKSARTESNHNDASPDDFARF